MKLFLSTYVNKIDSKGRISLPSSFRNILSKENKKEIILFKSIKFAAIDGCSYERINTISERIDNLDIFSEDQDDFSTSIFSEIVPTSLDKEGRFIIPNFLKKHANLKNEAAFIGQGNYFQIWHPKSALEKQKASRERIKANKKTLTSILINKSND
ncbi:MAG: Transcriptional regulator MraZ [Alphaproteobacteria bacterium MarineAlpha5_Bin9]|nr:MAG: Transcriptional regulator MraZ [Alphaproteobacteria bacterium MarineAlpha5_Bin9]